MPVKLYIWRNHRFVKALDHPGHTSILMTPIAGDTGQPADDVYASWWPDQSSTEIGLRRALETRPANTRRTYQEDEYQEMSAGARRGLSGGSFQPRVGQEQRLEQGFDEDGRPATIPVWVQKPEVVVEFPGNMELLTLQSGEKVPGVGLNVQRMLWFWRLFVNAPNARYKMISSQINCTAVALSLLEAGGIHLFTGKKLSRGSYLLPSSIIDYAEQARDKMQRINQTLVVLENEGFSTRDYAEPDFKNAVKSQRSRRTIRRVKLFSASKRHPILESVDLPAEVTDRYHAYTLPREIWSVAEWKKASYVRIGRRKEQVKEIDRILEEYHQLAPFHRQRPRAFLNKLTRLRDILEQAHDHMRSKFNSDRHEAVFQIAKQAQEVYQWCRLFEQEMYAAFAANNYDDDPAFETLERDGGLYPSWLQDEDTDTDSVCSLDEVSNADSYDSSPPARRSSLSDRNNFLSSTHRSETAPPNSTRSALRNHDLTASQLSYSGRCSQLEGSLPPQELNATVLVQVHSDAVIAAADPSGRSILREAERRTQTYRIDMASSERNELESSYQEELIGVYRV